jgi:hypothetical protein
LLRWKKKLSLLPSLRSPTTMSDSHPIPEQAKSLEDLDKPGFNM